MTFLFWNINGKPLNRMIATLAREHEVDILILAECQIDIVTLLRTLNVGETEKYEFAASYIPSERLKIFSLLPSHTIVPLRDDTHYTIRRLRPPIGEEITLIAAHLPSKLHQSGQEQALLATRLARIIRETEIDVGHTKTLVIGDLNMNPFETGLIAAEAFHAVMTRELALRESRIVNGEEKLFFYSPMWGRLGDNTPGPAGSYYYNSGSEINYFWNTFDQVLLRPSLLSRFNDADLQVLTEAEGISLLTVNGLPDTNLASDHLPLLFKLRI